jgi:hypothetical protein
MRRRSSGWIGSVHCDKQLKQAARYRAYLSNQRHQPSNQMMLVQIWNSLSSSALTPTSSKQWELGLSFVDGITNWLLNDIVIFGEGLMNTH